VRTNYGALPRRTLAVPLCSNSGQRLPPLRRYPPFTRRWKFQMFVRWLQYRTDSANCTQAADIGFATFPLRLQNQSASKPFMAKEYSPRKTVERFALRLSLQWRFWTARPRQSRAVEQKRDSALDLEYVPKLLPRTRAKFRLPVPVSVKYRSFVREPSMVSGFACHGPSTLSRNVTVSAILLFV